MLPSFHQIPTTDRIINLIQTSLKTILDRLSRNPILDYNLFLNQSLTTGHNLIAHGLGRKYLSCFVSPSGSVTITEGTSPDRSKYVELIASGPVTVSIYLF